MTHTLMHKLNKVVDLIHRVMYNYYNMPSVQESGVHAHNVWNMYSALTSPHASPVLEHTSAQEAGEGQAREREGEVESGQEHKAGDFFEMRAGGCFS
ncbi:hypothetical protein KSX_89610 [Ktedonospora formicarum]|uniref:Uncharacterized protein n=1 Tax=Ktedonospora formicarum TaxID=2778364 RepID=A0A8J3IBC5_9CHLR|nr:hypothetical protein KSX_89610 [Ktedonospora formicarum]